MLTQISFLIQKTETKVDKQSKSSENLKTCFPEFTVGDWECINLHFDQLNFCNINLIHLVQLYLVQIESLALVGQGDIL